MHRKEGRIYAYTTDKNKRILAPMVKAHDANRTALSYARGEATAKSYVDLPVGKGRLRGLFALGASHTDLVFAPVYDNSRNAEGTLLVFL